MSSFSSNSTRWNRLNRNKIYLLLLAVINHIVRNARNAYFYIHYFIPNVIINYVVSHVARVARVSLAVLALMFPKKRIKPKT